MIHVACIFDRLLLQDWIKEELDPEHYAYKSATESNSSGTTIYPNTEGVDIVAISNACEYVNSKQEQPNRLHEDGCYDEEAIIWVRSIQRTYVLILFAPVKRDNVLSFCFIDHRKETLNDKLGTTSTKLLALFDRIVVNNILCKPLRPANYNIISSR